MDIINKRKNVTHQQNSNGHKLSILWVSNIPISLYTRESTGKNMMFGGWLDGLYFSLEEKIKSREIQLTCTFPGNKNKDRVISNVSFLPFGKQFDSHYFSSIIAKSAPDLVHISGTEYSHTHNISALLNSYGIPYVISIQGLASTCAKSYLDGLPIFMLPTARDIYRGGVRSERNDMARRGKYEIMTLKRAAFVIGRTDWDKAYTLSINANAYYYHCDEVLRNEFYSGSWSYGHCDKFSIFISQLSYPIKGFHMIIDALRLLKRDFPTLRVYIASENIVKYTSASQRLKQTSYKRLVRKLIIKAGLQENIIFTGTLKANQMKSYYLKANVFLNCSLIENSSNAIAEAAILGTPIVASYVGGTPSMITHNQTGLLYPINDPQVAYLYIKDLFTNASLCNKLSHNSRKIYQEKMSIATNGRRLYHIYKDVLQKTTK